MYNVMDYADGEAINTGEINAEKAIKKASFDGTRGIFLPKGTYLVSKDFLNNFLGRSCTFEFEVGARIMSTD